MEPAHFCEHLAGFESDHDSTILPVFRDLDSVLAEFLGGMDSEGDIEDEFSVVYHLLAHLPADTGMFLGNSMSIRDADSCGMTGSHEIRIGTNRGASGIDGNIATAVGFASGLGKRTTLLIGDLAFLHDINSLVLASRSRVPVTIVLLNNDGGGLFSYLPIAEYRKHFERFFGAPHGLDFAHAAALFNLEYSKPTTISQFRDCLGRAFAAERSSIIDIRMDRDSSFARHQTVWEKAAEAIAGRIL
jgi:2-succinyl-5-enolpyruvyl-6-hydroxy-3-cyclohexene-1-carboxylate synthase